MNPSDWIKAAALVNQHKQEAATAETDQLSSMPLSQIAMDGSSPPVVHYGMHMPAATSTPTGTDVHKHSSQQEILISRLYWVFLRVHYTLLYHHLVQKQQLPKTRYKHFVIKCQKALINTYKMLNSIVH